LKIQYFVLNFDYIRVSVDLYPDVTEIVHKTNLSLKLSKKICLHFFLVIIPRVGVPYLERFFYILASIEESI